MKETVHYISDLSFYIHLSIPYASSVTLISNNAALLLLSPRTVSSHILFLLYWGGGGQDLFCGCSVEEWELRSGWAWVVLWVRFAKLLTRVLPFNEVYLEAPKKETKVAGDSPAKHKYVRLDSYDPYVGEIVSRKYTQLSEVSEETAIRYLKELENKYSPGSIIADVPSNKTGLNKDIFKANNGNVLKGQMILEVPVQKADIPPNVLEYAKKNDIIIRDVNEKNYNK